MGIVESEEDTSSQPLKQSGAIRLDWSLVRPRPIPASHGGFEFLEREIPVLKVVDPASPAMLLNGGYHTLKGP